MGAAAFGSYNIIYSVTQINALGVAVSVPLAMVIYGLLIILFGAVTEEELPEMPFGMRLLSLCERLRLLP